MNRSLQEKSSARLAAVQLLYKAVVSAEKPNAARLLADYQSFVEENADNPREATLPQVPASIGYLNKLLTGVLEHAETLEPHVEGVLTAEWKKERVSPLLLAILRLFTFEISHFETLKPAILINEYVDITARFFGEAETGFINAALNALSKSLRGHG